MKKIYLLSLASTFAGMSYAQNTLIKGRLVAEKDNSPIADLEVAIPSLKQIRTSDINGEFVFDNVKPGNYQVIVTNNNFAADTFNITVANEKTKSIGDLKINSQVANCADNYLLPIVALEESSFADDDDGFSDQSISGVLTASRDPFLSAASFTFGPLRYQIRGYRREDQNVYLNGIPMENLKTNFSTFSNWGGLNDAFRGQVVTFGLQPTEVGFGGLMGTTQIEATAMDQRQGTRISYSASNRTYRNRVMAGYNTGLQKNGWAFSAIGSRRWTQEGYVSGTFYDGWSLYLAASKKINASNSIHLTAFGAPTERGKSAPAIQEAMDIAGSNFYNPNWGYQDGEKRNSRVNNTFLPTAILTYKYQPDAKTIWNTSFGFTKGYIGNSSIDWYNGADPRPDYYKKLPSYYLYQSQGSNPTMAGIVEDYLRSDPERTMQVDWEGMYASNSMNYQNYNGTYGRRSIYILGEDREDITRFNLNSNFHKAIDNVKINAGIFAAYQQSENYRRILDLLGGDYFVNLNQFAERTFIGNNDYNQNDLNNPDQIVKVGDRYNYNYNSTFHNAGAWAQAQIALNHFDFFVSGRIASEGFQREGLYKNGLFKDVSYGKSEYYNFMTGGIKAGATYKINGRHYIYASGAYATNAPSFDNTFVSPRTRNVVNDNPIVSKKLSGEGGYLLRAPNVQGRFSVFATKYSDLTQVKRFFYDDYRTFVNYVMQNVDIQNIGAEFALKAKITSTLSVTGVATYTQAFYANRPDVSIYRDNDTNTTVSKTTTYLKDYYVAAGPQSAYTIGFNYNSPKYWYANVNFNYMDRNYVDVNPTRRTAEAVELLDRNGATYKSIIAQEKLPSYYTVDASIGTSLKIRRYIRTANNNMYLNINLGVNNLLNNKIITGAFEQLRYDYTTQNVDKYPTKYFYGYGANYFLNIGLRF